MGRKKTEEKSLITFLQPIKSAPSYHHQLFDDPLPLSLSRTKIIHIPVSALSLSLSLSLLCPGGLSSMAYGIPTINPPLPLFPLLGPDPGSWEGKRDPSHRHTVEKERKEDTERERPEQERERERAKGPESFPECSLLCSSSPSATSKPFIPLQARPHFAPGNPLFPSLLSLTFFFLSPSHYFGSSTRAKLPFIFHCTAL